MELAIIQKENLVTGENVQVLLEDRESINETEFKSFNSHSVQLQSSFIYGKMYDVKKQSGILFKIEGNLKSFRHLANQMISKEKFFAMALQFVQIMKSVKYPENLLLDLDYIYVDNEQEQIKLIYLPIINNHVKYNPADFFKEYLHIFKLQKDEASFATEYFQYFRTLQHFSLKSFEAFLIELSGMQPQKMKKKEEISTTPNGNADVELVSYDVLSAVQQESTPEPMFIQPQVHAPDINIQVNTEGPQFCTQCGEKAKAKANFCTKCGHNLKLDQTTKASQPKHAQVEVASSSSYTFQPQGMSKSTSPVQVEVSVVSSVQTQPSQQAEYRNLDLNGTTVLGEYEEDEIEGTTVLGEEVIIKAYIKRQKTDDVVCIENDDFVIGKDPNRCHYFVEGNSAISRTHAKIQMIQERYYLIDCNSTNKSYVDGQKLTANQPFEIFNGANIRLANEDFYFILE